MAGGAGRGASGRALRRDHHGRERPLGQAPRRVGRGRARRGRRRRQGAPARRGRARRKGADGLLLLDRELVAPAGRGRALMRMFSRRIRERDPRAARRRACGCASSAAARGSRGRSRARWTGPRRRPADNDRITLFVAFNYGGRAEILDAAAALRRRRRGRVPAAALRARDARPRPDHPHERRAAALELPALAVGVLRARLPRRALAGLHPRGLRGVARRVRRTRRRYGGR